MEHRKNRRRLTQKPDHSKMLQRNLMTSLVLYEAVRTTRRRAKVVQPLVDQLIVTAKKQNAQVAIRAINRVVTDKNASRKLLEVLAKRYADRSSGFTTIAPAGARKGDGAELVDFSLLEGAATTSSTNPKKTKKKSSSSPPSSVSSKA